MKVADWEVVDGFKCRQLDYSMVISNLAIVSKNCSNTEKQVIKPVFVFIPFELTLFISVIFNFK